MSECVILTTGLNTYFSDIITEFVSSPVTSLVM